MHPPDFTVHHRLSDWPDCRLELHCPKTGRVVDYPVRLLLQRTRDRIFADVLKALRCKCCGERPAPVYLVAGIGRRPGAGPPPSWAVELVSAPPAG